MDVDGIPSAYSIYKRIMKDMQARIHVNIWAMGYTRIKFESHAHAHTLSRRALFTYRHGVNSTYNFVYMENGIDGAYASRLYCVQSHRMYPVNSGNGNGNDWTKDRRVDDMYFTSAHTSVYESDRERCCSFVECRGSVVIVAVCAACIWCCSQLATYNVHTHRVYIK